MVNRRRFRGLSVIGVTGLLLCGLADSQPAAADGLEDYVKSSVPPEAVLLADDATYLAGVYTSLSGALDIASTFAHTFGILSAPPDKVTQEFAQLNQHLDAVAVTLSWQIAATDREDRLAKAQADVTDAQQIVQATGQPVPIDSAVELDSEQQASQAEADIAFERYFNEQATDGPAENFPMGTRVGIPSHPQWKQLMSDRPTVSNGLVYDWRSGVPALMQVIALRVQVMAAVDPNFRTSGLFRQELIGHRNKLLSQIAKMNDGVRCFDLMETNDDVVQSDGSVGGGNVEHHTVCADIYTGTAAFGLPLINDPVSDNSSDPFWYQNNVQVTLNRLRQEVLATMPLRQMYALAKSLLTYEDIPGELLLTGGSTWSTLPVAAADGAGGFTVNNIPLGNFATFAKWTGAAAIRGDFDRDGRPDIALVGVPGWHSVPVAFDNGGGTVRYTNIPMSDFPGFSSQDGVKPVGGDFNGDGYADIALVGGPWWEGVPVALGNGDGSFSLKNNYLDQFPGWSATAGAIPVSGDFNGDGLSDIALVGPAGWQSIPIASSNGDGTFSWTNASVDNIPYWASLSNVQPVAGDFNGDGTTDIALVGHQGWHSVPIAFSIGDGSGSFAVYNSHISGFTNWASSPGAVAVGDDFNNDGIGDIALTGGDFWPGFIPLALSNSDGTFSTTTPLVANFPSWAEAHGVLIVGSAHPAQRQ